MRRALVVGIDHYDRYSDLGGCVNDAEALAPLLTRNDDQTLNFDCRQIVATSSDGSRVTRAELLQNLDRLLAAGVEVSLFYFAGHGSTAGREHGDVWLVTSDGSEDTPGVKFSEILEMINQARQEVIVILDCCFSGGAGSVPAALVAGDVLRSGLSILTASRSDEVSAETAAGRGLFSTYLEGALTGGAADVLGHVTVATLYAYLSEAFGAWNQRPTFKANIDRLQDIRRCRETIRLSTIQQLPVWFAQPDSLFALDPSYEPTEEPRDPDHEEIFSQLQRCVSSKLVEPVDEEHMYFAAIHRKACRLTPLGRHYRSLAAQGLV